MTIGTVLFDLDGVLIDYDQSLILDIEQRHDLKPGSLFATAFEPTLLESVITGKTTRVDWFAQVGIRLGSPAAAQEWYGFQGTVNQAVLEKADSLQAAGYLTAILTNGTDETRDLVDSLGILGHFDAFFNSSEIGYAKPDIRVFQHVCDALDVEPATVFFLDDSESKLVGADKLGIQTHHFTGLDTFSRAFSRL